MELPPTSSKGWVRSVLHRAKAKTHGKWQSSGREMANGEQQQQKQNGIITMFTRRCSIHHWTDVGDTVLRVEKMGAAGILKYLFSFQFSYSRVDQAPLNSHVIFYFYGN